MLYKRIRERRNELKLSQEFMSNKLGITRQGYGHYETGRNEPDSQTLLKISVILDCTTDYLYGKSDEPKAYNSSKEIYNPIEEINKIIKNLGLEEGASGLFDIEKWKNLGPEDVEEICKHFEWVVHKAKKRKNNTNANDTDGLEKQGDGSRV